MKRLKILILITASLLLAAPAPAATKLDARNDLDQAKKLMERLESNDLIRDFIPHKNFYDAKVYLDTATFQFDEEKDYKVASYYAVLASIEIETTITIAKSRYKRNRKLEIEKEFCKKIAAGQSKKSALKIHLIESGVAREGASSYRSMLLDVSIFSPNSIVLNDQGKELLDRIYELLKLYPSSRLTIVGHTRQGDPDNVISVKKAESVAGYFTVSKGITPKRISFSGAGDTVPVESNNKKYPINRVEVSISGLK
jgi:outer membrane protein OmpA-like peptidoglycan-associated protein